MTRYGSLLAVLLLAGAGQDDVARELVRSLGTGDLSEREAAQQKLAARGEAARAALEDGARNADAEISSRAKALLRRLDLLREFPDLPAVLPGALERLAGNAAVEWVRVFLELGEKNSTSRRDRRCFHALAPRALRAASTADQKKAVCRALASSPPPAVLPEVLRLLRDEDEGVREQAAGALGLRDFEHERELAALLDDPSPAARQGGIKALMRVFQDDAIPLVLPRVRDPAPAVRKLLAGELRQIQQGLKIGDAVKELLPLLKDPDSWTRWDVVSILGEEPLPDAIPALLVCLKDVDELVRRDAAYALGYAGAREAAAALERLLADADDGVRQGAAFALGKIGARGAIPALLRAAGPAEKEVDTRATALEALGELKAREGLDAARGLLKDAAPELRRAAARLLWTIEGEAAAERLAPLLRDDDRETSEAVERLFLEAPGPRVAAALLPLLEEDDAGARTRAVRILSIHPVEEAQPALARRLTEADSSIANRVLDMDWIPSPETEKELRKLLGHASAEVRARAAEVLLDLGGRRVADELAPHLKPEAETPYARPLNRLGELRRPEDLSYFLRHLGDPNAAEAASWAITLQAPRDAAPGLLKLLPTAPAGVQARVLGLLGGFALPETEEAVALMLGSGNAEVRTSALQALVRLGAGSRIPAILPLLDRPEGPATVIHALGELGAVDALPRLRTFLTDADADLRQAAIRAVAQLKDRESVPALLKMLDEPDDQRGRFACYALSMLGAPEAAPRLLKVVEEDGEGPRALALWALARLGAKDVAPAFLPHLHEWGGLDRPENAEALGVLGAREVVPELRSRLRHRHALVRQGAATALGDMGAAEAVPDLLPLLRDRSDWVVAAAADALGRLQAKEAVPVLREILARRAWTSSGENLWAEIFVALVRLQAREAAPDFLEQLVGPDAERRLQALEALRQLRDPETLPLLQRRLAEKGASLQLQAPRVPAEERGKIPSFLYARELSAKGSLLACSMPQVLADLDAREFLPDLRRLLTSSSVEARRAAADALCRFGAVDGAPLLLAEAERGARGTLFALNALRRPALWSRLQDARLRGVRRFTRPEVWEEVARALDLRLDLSGRGWPGAYASPIESEQRRFLDGGCSLLDVAAWLLQDTRMVLILEDDRLQVVPEAEALPFWQAWRKEVLTK